METSGLPPATRLRRTLLLGSGVPLLALLVVAALLWWQTAPIQRQGAWVQHVVEIRAGTPG
jgi:hypothetical protein